MGSRQLQTVPLQPNRAISENVNKILVPGLPSYHHQSVRRTRQNDRMLRASVLGSASRKRNDEKSTGRKTGVCPGARLSRTFYYPLPATPIDGRIVLGKNVVVEIATRLAVALQLVLCVRTFSSNISGRVSRTEQIRVAN